CVARVPMCVTTRDRRPPTHRDAHKAQLWSRWSGVRVPSATLAKSAAYAALFILDCARAQASAAHMSVTVPLVVNEPWAGTPRRRVDRLRRKLGREEQSTGRACAQLIREEEGEGPTLDADRGGAVVVWEHIPG